MEKILAGIFGTKFFAATGIRRKLMNKQELKPCPFCGGESFDDTWPDDFGVLSGSIACDCGARGIELDCDNKTKGELIDHWNTRPVEDELRQENEQLKANLEASQASLKEHMQELVKREKQIEKMKNCSNCKWHKEMTREAYDKCELCGYFSRSNRDIPEGWELKEAD